MRLLFPGLALATAAFASACGDSPTRPGPGTGTPVTVSVNGNVVDTRYPIDKSGIPTLQCDVQLQAAASASSGSGAGPNWGDAVFRIYAGTERSTPVDSVAIPVAEVVASWGSSTVPRELTLSRWRFTSRVPVELEFVFRYSGGSTTPLRLACGPVPAAGSAAPGATAISAGGVEAEVGGKLRITYTATAPGGLFYSGVALSGPFADTVVAAATQPGTTTASSIVVEVPIPASAGIGQPVRARVFVVDAAGRQTTSEVTGARIVDRTPPALEAMLSRTYDLDSPVAGGERISLLTWASDNGSVERLIYRFEGGGSRTDSLPFTGDGEIELPTDPLWSGPTTLSMWVRDRGGNLSKVVASPPGGLGFYPRVARPTRTFVIGRIRHSVALDGVFYLGLGGGELVRVPTASLQPSTIAQVPGLLYFDVTQDGARLWGTTDQRRDGVYYADLTGPNATPRFIQVPNVYLETVHVAANGRAFAADGHSSGGAIWEFSHEAGTARMRPVIRGTPRGARNLGGTRLYFDLAEECNRFYDSGTDTFGGCVALSGNRASYSLNQAGSRIARAFRVETTTGDLVRHLQGGLSTMGISALSPDGAFLYAAAPDGIDRIRVSDGVILERIALPQMPTGPASGVQQLLFAGPRTLVVVALAADEPAPPYSRVFVIETP